MILNQINMKQILPIVLICGLLGGGLLITTTLLPIKGWWIILTYAIAMFGTMYVVKADKKIELTYIKTVVIGVPTFIVMTYVLYFYIITFDNPNNGITFFGHMWRFLMVLGLALISSAILGLFFMKRNHDSIQTS